MKRPILIILPFRQTLAVHSISVVLVLLLILLPLSVTTYLTLWVVNPVVEHEILATESVIVDMTVDGLMVKVVNAAPRPEFM